MKLVGFDRARRRQSRRPRLCARRRRRGRSVRSAHTAAWNRHRDRVDVVVGLRGLTAHGRDGGDGGGTWSCAFDDQLFRLLGADDARTPQRRQRDDTR